MEKEDDVKVVRKEFPGCRQWNELSLEELVRVWEIKQMHSGPNERMERALKVWLYLNDAKIVNLDFDTESGEWKHGLVVHPTGDDEKDEEMAARYDDKDLVIHLLGLHIPKEVRDTVKREGTEEEKKKNKLSLIADLLGKVPRFGGKGNGGSQNKIGENGDGVHNEELPDDVEGCMEWLEKNDGLTQFNDKMMEFGGRRFFLPSPGMVNETWKQYNYTSALARNSFIIEQGIKKKLMKDLPDMQGYSEEDLVKTVEGIDEDGRKLIEAQARFLAHILVPAVWKWKDGSNGNDGMGSDVPDGAVEVRRIEYNSTTAECLKDWFVIAAEKDIQGFMFWNWALMMYLDGCHAAFQKDSELKILFKGGGEEDKRSPVMRETDTVNAIMKWMQAYPTQEDVYNNNAVMILGNLKDMAKEAERIDRMTKKR